MLALFPGTYFITTVLNVKILIKFIEQAGLNFSENKENIYILKWFYSQKCL